MKKSYSIIGLIMASVLFFAGIAHQFVIFAANSADDPTLTPAVGVESGMSGLDTLFYKNQTMVGDADMISGADPGAVYYTDAEMEDTYNKMKAYYAQSCKSGFEEKFGTLAEFKADYAERFYMALTTGAHQGVDSSLGLGSTVDYSVFQLYSSEDLSTWELIGKSNGDAFIRQNGAWLWVNQDTWAPELIRDPVSGLFLIYFTTVGNSESETNKLSGSGGTSRQLCVGYSETPDGPYLLLTGEIYYSYLCEYSNGAVKTTPAPNGATYATYRSDIRSDRAFLTEVRDGKFVNLNGESVGKSDPLLNFSYYHVDGYMGIEKGIASSFNTDTSSYFAVDGVTKRAKIAAIDPHPFFDSEGNLFVYFVIEGSGIWVVAMRDVVTPDWKTLTRVAMPGYGTVYSDGSDPFGTTSRALSTNDSSAEYEGNVNEGVFVVEQDGFFYLFYSRIGLGGDGNRNNTKYDVLLAVADNPFGPFIKTTSLNPVIGYNSENDFAQGTGHCSIVKAGNQYWVMYCANKMENGEPAGGRYIGWDRIEFLTHDNVTFEQLKATEISKNSSAQAALTAGFAAKNGHTYQSKGDATAVMAIPFGNGPTYTNQPAHGGAGVAYNLLESTDCSIEILEGNSATAKYLNDGVFSAVSRASGSYEVSASGTGNLTVKISFEAPKVISALMIYNAFEYNYTVKQISSIQFSLEGEDVGSVSNLAFPSEAFYQTGTLWKTNHVRHGVAASYNPDSAIVADTVTVTLTKSDKRVSNSNPIRISEIMVLGGEVDDTFCVDAEGYRLVSSADQLIGADKSAGVKYRLVKDLYVQYTNLTGDIFCSNTPFEGEFDGNGYSIYIVNSTKQTAGLLNLGGNAYVHDLTVRGKMKASVSLFGSLKGQGACNVKLERVTADVVTIGVSASSDGAGIFLATVGASGSSSVKKVQLISCTNKSSIESRETCPAASGMIGRVLDGTEVVLEDCFNRPQTATADGYKGLIGKNAGGLIGAVDGTTANVQLVNCYNHCKPDSIGNGYAGALIGYVSDSSTVSIVNAFNSDAAMPLVGEGNATVTQSYDAQLKLSDNDCWAVVSNGQGAYIQLSVEQDAVRFLAGFGGRPESYYYVGLLVTAQSDGATVGGYRYMTKEIYKSINAGVGEQASAADLFGEGCSYLFALSVTDLCLADYENLEFCVTPYAIDKTGSFVFGETTVFSVK